MGTQLRDHVDDIEILMGVLNLLPNPVFVKNANKELIAVNDAHCIFTGLQRHELIGKTDFDFHLMEQAKIFAEIDEKVFETQQEIVNLEKNTNKQGDIRWVEARKSYYETTNGVPYLIGVLTDVTELEQQKKASQIAEEKAKQASISKSQFLANMSHEIRTPMNGIMGMSEVLLNSGLTPRQTDMAKIITRSGNALLTIINDILDFSKAESGQIELDPAPFHLRNCIEDVTTLLASTISDTGLDLLVRIQPGLPQRFVGDVGRIRQILTNIIGNAVKFTHTGHVLIDVGGEIIADIANLNIQVIDTGIGIAKDKQDHIFEKFSQADGSTTREYGGTGLGLSISKQLTELMGGKITVTSEIGAGTNFSIALPLSVAAASESKIKSTDLNIAGSNILIIDDNPVNRDILTEQLRYWRCNTAAVQSSKIGLTVLRKALDQKVKIDLVIVDYQMPDESGEDFYRAKQKQAELADIPVIMLSSVDGSELRARMNSLNISNFLTKPAKSSVLYDAIAQEVCGSVVSSLRVEKSSYETNIIMPSSASSKESVADRESHIDLLIAEDNEVNQIYVCYAMEELGLSYKIVPNGKMAIDKWRLLSPRAILMDISMPVMNGYEATQAIREIEKSEGLTPTPIIAVTAHSMKGDDRDCLEKGMDDYLSKPLSMAALRQHLKKWGVISEVSLEGEDIV